MGSDAAQEQVTFIPHHLPGLEAGEYQVTVSQHVDDAGNNRITDDPLVSTYRFAVRSDRFSLKKPGETVYAVFPADNATGEYSAVLPHVVFARPTFPWMRSPTPGNSAATADSAADVPTWLAVLLIDQDDPATTLTTGTLGDLFPSKVCASSSLGTDYSYFWSAADASGLEPGEQLTDPVRMLILPLNFFWSIAPAAEDLALLAHVRRVSLLPKATGTGATGQGEPIGDFAAVFGSRLPQTQRKTQAVLVSLEGLAPFLPTRDGGPPTGTTFDGSRNIRLAVLASWTFFSTGDSARFTERLLALDGAAPAQGPAADASLRLPYRGSDVTVRKATAAGYAPLDHRLRTGGRTVSWYRGPLTPYQVARGGLSFPISSADQATAFDPTTGLFDVSCAAAWTLGRMLALQDRAFSAALYRWKKGLARKAAAAVGNNAVQQRFSALLRHQAARPGAAAAPAEPAAAAAAPALLRSVLTMLAEPRR